MHAIVLPLLYSAIQKEILKTFLNATTPPLGYHVNLCKCGHINYKAQINHAHKVQCIG